MKMNKQYFGRWAGLLGAALLVMSPIGVTSCTEDISEDAFAVKSMNTMMDCINATDNAEQVFLHGLTYAEGQIFYRSGWHGQQGAHNGQSVFLSCLLQ